MPDYLIHKSKTGIANTAEWQETDMHQLQNQAAGDILYAADGTHLTRLAKQSDGNKLVLASGVPAWVSSQHAHGAATEAAGGQLTSPFINEAVAMSVTSTNLNLVDDANFLATLWGRGNFVTYTTLGIDWTKSVTGSGGAYGSQAYTTVNTGITNSSTSVESISILNLRAGSSFGALPFSKAQCIQFNIERNGSTANAIARVQLKTVSTIGAIADKGIEILTKNLALYGAGYGSARGEVSLGVTMSEWNTYGIRIIHTPATPQIDFYVDSGSGFPATPNASITATANIPQADSSGAYFVISTEKDAVATDCYLTVGCPILYSAY